MRNQPRFARQAWVAALVTIGISGCSMMHDPARVTRPGGVASYESDAWAASPGGTQPDWSAITREPHAARRPAPAPARPSEFGVDHPKVDVYVEKFGTNLRGFFETALDRSGRYVPHMQAILREEGVPVELAYLPLIESGYRDHAVSRAGATGQWQFIRATGRRYGLRIDRYVDERRDPVKATQAAARYLRDLHQMFGSWHLSVAAYNVGEMRISRNLQRVGPESYWDMSARGALPHETREYVPQFLAALRIARNPNRYGFDPPPLRPVSYDVVWVNGSLSFGSIAKMVDASVAEIADLNPALLRKVTPPDREPYPLRVPKGTRQQFEAAYSRLDRKVETAAVQRAEGSAAPGAGLTTYRVRRGDTPSVIARRLGVSVDALMKENRWKNARRLRPGSTVRVPVAAS